MNGVQPDKNFPPFALKPRSPSDLRTYYQPFICGLVGGASAVAFQLLTQILFPFVALDQANKSLGFYFAGEFLGDRRHPSHCRLHSHLRLKRSGRKRDSPVKAAFWRDFGYLPFALFRQNFLLCSDHHRQRLELRERGSYRSYRERAASELIRRPVWKHKQERRPSALWPDAATDFSGSL